MRLFSLTTEETRLVLFVVSALLLGVTVKHCRQVNAERQARPIPGPPEPVQIETRVPAPDEAVPNP